MSISPVTTRSWLPARQRSQRVARQRHAAVRLRAVAHQVAQAPDLVRRPARPRRRAPPRRRAGCRARLRAGRCASWCLLQCRTMEAFAAAAGDRRRGGRGRRGHVPAPAAQRPDRARLGGRRSSTSRPAQLDRAEDFREPQRLLGLAGLGVGGATLARARLAPAARRLDRLAARRPLLGRRRRGGGDLARCSSSWAARWRAWRTSAPATWASSTQAWPDWARRRGEVGRRSARSSPAIGGPWPLALVRRFPRRWWVPGRRRWSWRSAWSRSGSVPVVIDPLFNRFEPLRRGPLRSEVLELARPRRRGRGRGLPGGREPADDRRERLRERARAQQAGGALRQPDRRLPARPGAAWWWRTSSGTRSTTTCCAGSRGWRSWRPPGTLPGPGAGRAVRPPRAARRPAGRPAAALPAMALAVALVAVGLGVASNVLSRQVEARADAFALDLTRDPAAFVELERRIAVRNISDPDPPRLFQLLFGDAPHHRVERIGNRGTRHSCRRHPALIERVVRELASYERPSASAGERRAAEWLARELEAAGCRDVRVEEERAHGGYWWPLGLLNAAAALAALARPPARGARGRPGGGGGLRRRGRRAALVPARGAAAPPDLERRGRGRGPGCRAHRRLHRPPRRRPQRARVPPRAAAGRHGLRSRSSTRRRTRASRSCTASSSGRCSWRSGACWAARWLRRRHVLLARRQRRPWRTSAPARVVPGRQRQPELRGRARGAGPRAGEQPARACA